MSIGGINVNAFLEDLVGILLGIQAALERIADALEESDER